MIPQIRTSSADTLNRLLWGPKENTQLSPEKIAGHLEEIQSLTDAYTDHNGHRIQLWKHKNEIYGTVSENTGKIAILLDSFRFPLVTSLFGLYESNPFTFAFKHFALFTISFC